MLEWISGFRLDLRFAARVFGKRPAFTAVAVITLASASAPLRPSSASSMPYSFARFPTRIHPAWPLSGSPAPAKRPSRPYSTRRLIYLEFRAHARSFENLGAATWARVASPVLTGHGPARQILAIPATASFFETLGVSAALGRTFLPEDETRGCSLLLAHSFWKPLGADTVIAGKSLALDEKPCTVLGVMPERFSFYPRPTQAWMLIGPPRSPLCQYP